VINKKTPRKSGLGGSNVNDSKEAKTGIGSPDVLVKGRTKVYGESNLILNGLIVC